LGPADITNEFVEEYLNSWVPNDAMVELLHQDYNLGDRPDCQLHAKTGFGTNVKNRMKSLIKLCHKIRFTGRPVPSLGLDSNKDDLTRTASSFYTCILSKLSAKVRIVTRHVSSAYMGEMISNRNYRPVCTMPRMQEFPITIQQVAEVSSHEALLLAHLVGSLMIESGYIAISTNSYSPATADCVRLGYVTASGTEVLRHNTSDGLRTLAYDEVGGHESEFDHLIELIMSRERTSVSVIDNGGLRRLYAAVMVDWSPDLTCPGASGSSDDDNRVQEEWGSQSGEDYDWRKGGYYGVLHDLEDTAEPGSNVEGGSSSSQDTPDNSRPPGLIDSVFYPSLESAITALKLVMGYPTTGVAAENISPKFSMRSYGSTLAVHTGQSRIVDIGDMGPALQAACALVEGGRSSDADLLAASALVSYLTGHVESDIPLIVDELQSRISTSKGFVKQGLKRIVQVCVSYLSSCKFKAPITESSRVEDILSLHPRGNLQPPSRQIAIVSPKSAIEVVKMRGKLNLNDLLEGEVDILDFLSGS